MTTIKVYFANGHIHTFDGSRSGGSWTNSVRYEGEFAIVTDVWGKETAYPSANIEKVEKIPDRY